VKPAIFLRSASVLTFIHCVLHTIGGVFGKPRNGTEEILVQDTMKLHVFNVMGSMRSYWDFNLGYGLTLTLTLLVESLLFWHLATLTKTNAAWTRPIVALFFFNFFVMALVSWRYFFIAPAITEFLIAACLSAAYLTAAPRS
jgi:hypothetical protein